MTPAMEGLGMVNFALVPVSILAVGVVAYLVVMTKPELVLHTAVMMVGVICLTILCGLKRIDGPTVAGTIAGLGGLSSVVTGLHTVKGGPS